MLKIKLHVFYHRMKVKKIIDFVIMVEAPDIKQERKQKR